LSGYPNRISSQLGVEILLVEDNPDDEELTLMTLEQHNIAHSIKVVHDGAEALDYLFGNGIYEQQTIGHPRLVLLDLKLPKRSGVEVLEHIKGDARTRKIPVVVLTSSREDPDIKRCYELGANSYVVKPVDFDQFKYTIKQLGMYWQTLNQPPVD
jgi:two-component system response regulator